MPAGTFGVSFSLFPAHLGSPEVKPTSSAAVVLLPAVSTRYVAFPSALLQNAHAEVQLRNQNPDLQP
jgi:hypothetical protein